MINLNTRIRRGFMLCLLGLYSLGATAQINESLVRSVGTGTDDAEEYLPGGTGTVGQIDFSSSDVEIMFDGTKRQIIGLRFANITIPQGSVIQSAHIQFTTKGDKDPVLGDAYITAEAVDNALTFNGTSFNITNRTPLADSVLWTGSANVTWGTTAAGTAGADQQTPDITTLIQNIINRTAWIKGNALVLMLKGEGVRNAFSYDGNNSAAAKLVIQYTNASTPPLAIAVSAFPIDLHSGWRYLDNGTDLGTAWRSASFQDTMWAIGYGKMGYGDSPETNIAYGPYADNKYITSYFRKKFNVASVAALRDSLDLSLIRDDGAIVYINGVEVVRSNMPAGTINYLTNASSAIDVNETAINSFHIPKSVLVDGENIITVELHQVNGTSSDLTFDLALAELLPAPMAVINFPVPQNSEWKYLDNGTDLGTAWTTAAYNDSTWSFGPGKLGYDDAPTTALSYGADPNNKYITYYLRKRINVADITALQDSLELKLLRDDGAIVYINGVEVVRSNMPTGPVTFQTLAISTVNAPEESTYYVYHIPKNVLVDGENIIAVELHQQSITSSDIGFDLSLEELPVLYFPVSNNAIKFDGSAGKVVKVPNASFGNPSGDFSIEAWARIDAGGSAEDDIVSTHENPGTRAGYFIEYAHPGGSSPGIRAGMATSGNSWLNAQYNITWQPGQWHHVVMTYNATTKMIKLYQDGILVANNTFTGGQTPVFSTRPFAIGGSDNYTNNGFNGAIDEVYFWNKELTATEVDATAHLNRLASSINLKAYYPMDTITATINDASPNALNGTATSLVATDLIPSYAPVKFNPLPNIYRYKAAWYGANETENGGMQIGLPYTTDNAHVIHGYTADTGIATTGLPAGVVSRMKRSWHLEKKGIGVYANQIKFSLLQNELQPSSTGTMYLLRSEDGVNFDFASNDTGVVTNGIVHFSIADTADAYFTLGFSQMAVIETPMIPLNSAWKYLDNGTDQGTVWKEANFNDASWNTGDAELGYGDNNETTVVSYGPDAANKYPTTYFRKTFTVNDLNGFNSVKVRLLKDDGAILYINGAEAFRSNMPYGNVSYNTYAVTAIDGANESAYTDYYLPKTLFQTGTNTIAVEIHQVNAGSSDISFNLEMTKDLSVPTTLSCDVMPATHISNFVSVLPSAQPDSLRIPGTHTFQMLLQSGTPYTNIANGNTKSTFDFTGYVPISGSSTNGYLSINHEEGSWPLAGVSMLDINFNSTSQLWTITNNQPVDFGVVAGTGRNCSGTVTPWNTIVTCEEILPTNDVNSDGYQDVGWAVEIDPATRSVVDHNNDNQPDKLWGVGRMSHENVVVAPDMKTLYEGNDENPGFIFRFVADTATKLGSGTLYVLKLDGTDLTTATEGEWIVVPNSTPAESNNVTSFAAGVAATNFQNIEDVEISPLDSMIYFTSKSSSRVYRFKDNGTTVSDFSIFVGNSNTMYDITYNGGIAAEQWRDGNDNLTFDDEGNLYVIQDGGRNHIWMVRPCHSAVNPQVQLFAVTPDGCEPTGMTFSPDHKFMFVSMQHPNSGNATQMMDATGNLVRFNKESAIVIARKEFLGTNTPLPITFSTFEAYKTIDNKALLDWAYVTDETIVRFDVQRMVPGSNFETIGSVTGVNGQKGKYTFTDERPYAGKNLYRIRAVVRDNKEVFSDVRLVTLGMEDKLAFVKTYPNPATNAFHVVMISPDARKATIKLVNMTGVEVLHKNVSLVQGNNDIDVNVADLAAGVYNIVVVSDKETLHTRIVKQ